MSTNISWASESWNPVTGCSKISEGCRNCYAAAMAPRLAAQGIEGYTELPWTYPNAAANVHLHYDRLCRPLRWRRPRTAFVNSMSDLWHEQVPDEFIDRVFAAMAVCPRHTFQILTKRPQRMKAYLAQSTAHDEWEHRIEHLGFELLRERGVTDYPIVEAPLHNVWLGTSVEDQRAAEERVPHLLATPAAVRFLSCEPLLGPVDLRAISHTCAYSGEPMHFDALSANVDEGLYFEDHPDGYVADSGSPLCPKVDWVIAGGESGPKYRTMDLDWARGLRDQARSAGIAFFYKQSSGQRPGTEPILDGMQWRQFPPGPADAVYTGPQSASRHTAPRTATAHTPAMFEDSDG